MVLYLPNALSAHMSSHTVQRTEKYLIHISVWPHALWPRACEMSFPHLYLQHSFGWSAFFSLILCCVLQTVEERQGQGKYFHRFYSASALFQPFIITLNSLQFDLCAWYNKEKMIKVIIKHWLMKKISRINVSRCSIICKIILYNNTMWTMFCLLISTGIVTVIHIIMKIQVFFWVWGVFC